MNFKIKIRIFFWSILAAIVGLILYMGVAPSGRIGYKTDFKKNNYFFGQLTPEERVIRKEAGYSMTGDPVYFSLRAPRKFNKAKLTVKYKDNSQSPLIEAGVLLDKQVWNYGLKPIQNKTLEMLKTEWNVVNGPNTTLLQRNKKYPSIESFLADLPTLDEVAVYNYDLKLNYKLDNYTATTAKQEINIPLRGPYQFYTYLKNEDLYFKFFLADLNKNKDADGIQINLYKNGDLVSAQSLADDGIALETSEKTKARDLIIKEEGLVEGVYKVELKCNTDVVTEKIETTQNKISFINRLWIAEGAPINLSLYSDARVINAQTTNPGRLQTIKVGNDGLDIKETFKQFGIRTKDAINKIRLEKDDVILAGDGMFSFGYDSLFNPVLKKINENSDVNKDGINYILADYKSPQDDNGWKIAEVALDISQAYRENGKYSFLISAPRLGTPLNTGDILIGEIKIDLSGKNIFEFIKKYFIK